MLRLLPVVAVLWLLLTGAASGKSAYTADPPRADSLLNLSKASSPGALRTREGIRKSDPFHDEPTPEGTLCHNDPINSVDVPGLWGVGCSNGWLLDFAWHFGPGHAKGVYGKGRLTANEWTGGALDAYSIERTYIWGADLSGSRGGVGGAGGLLLIREKRLGAGQATDYLPLYDGSGHVVGLSDQDGDLVATYVWGPFGELISATGPMAGLNPIRYATKYFDVETGLYYFGHRYYDPVTAQWLSREPLGEDESLNLYAYCRNDPVNHVDVLGLWGFNSSNGVVLDSLWNIGARLIAGQDPISISSDPCSGTNSSDLPSLQDSLDNLHVGAIDVTGAATRRIRASQDWFYEAGGAFRYLSENGDPTNVGANAFLGTVGDIYSAIGASSDDRALALASERVGARIDIEGMVSDGNVSLLEMSQIFGVAAGEPFGWNSAADLYSGYDLSTMEELRREDKVQIGLGLSSRALGGSVAVRSFAPRTTEKFAETFGSFDDYWRASNPQAKIDSLVEQYDLGKHLAGKEVVYAGEKLGVSGGVHPLSPNTIKIYDEGLSLGDRHFVETLIEEAHHSKLLNLYPESGLPANNSWWNSVVEPRAKSYAEQYGIRIFGQ